MIDDSIEQLQSVMTLMDFKLTGSRRMAERYPDLIKVDESSDWDYYAQISEENENFLLANDFECAWDVRNHDEQWYCPEKFIYCDMLFVSLFKHKKFNIDVILRSNADLYQKTFENIGGHEYCLYLWKRSPYLPEYKEYNLQSFGQMTPEILFRIQQRIVLHFNNSFQFYGGRLSINDHQYSKLDHDYDGIW